jgi:hypothetical protein
MLRVALCRRPGRKKLGRFLPLSRFSYPGGDAFGPATQQIPGSQAQVFGYEQPEADQITGNLIGQELADAAFHAQVIELFPPILVDGSKGLHFHGGALGVELIEFFFAARTER